MEAQLDAVNDTPALDRAIAIDEEQELPGALADTQKK